MSSFDSPTQEDADINAEEKVPYRRSKYAPSTHTPEHYWQCPQIFKLQKEYRNQEACPDSLLMEISHFVEHRRCNVDGMNLKAWVDHKAMRDEEALRENGCRIESFQAGYDLDADDEDEEHVDDVTSPGAEEGVDLKGMCRDAFLDSDDDFVPHVTQIRSDCKWNDIVSESNKRQKFCRDSPPSSSDTVSESKEYKETNIQDLNDASSVLATMWESVDTMWESAFGWSIADVPPVNLEVQDTTMEQLYAMRFRRLGEADEDAVAEALKSTMEPHIRALRTEERVEWETTIISYEVIEVVDVP